MNEALKVVGIYHVACIDSKGHIKWEDVARNLVPYQGKNAILDTYFAGTDYTASCYMSLITAGTATTGSTYVAPTVTEVTADILAARQAMTWTASVNGSKAANAVNCAMIGNATITGLMVVAGTGSISTIGDTTSAGAVLISAANFAGGSKTVSSGDSLICNYTFSI